MCAHNITVRMASTFHIQLVTENKIKLIAFIEQLLGKYDKVYWFRKVKVKELMPLSFGVLQAHVTSVSELHCEKR